MTTLRELLNDVCIICGYPFVQIQKLRDGSEKIMDFKNKKLRLTKEKSKSIIECIEDFGNLDLSIELAVCVKCFRRIERVNTMVAEVKKIKSDLSESFKQVCNLYSLDLSSERKPVLEKKMQSQMKCQKMPNKLFVVTRVRPIQPKQWADSTNTSVVTSKVTPSQNTVSNSSVVTSMFSPLQTTVTTDLTNTSVVTPKFAPFPTIVTNTSVVTSKFAPFPTTVTNTSVVTSKFAPFPTTVTNTSVVTSKFAPFPTTVTNTSVVTSKFAPFPTTVTNTSVVTSKFAPFPTTVTNTSVVTSKFAPFPTTVTNASVVTSKFAPFPIAVTNTSVVTSMFTPFSTAVTNTSVVTSMFAPFPTAVSNSDVVTSMYTPPQTLVTMDLTKTSVVTSMFAPFPTAVTNTSVVTSMIAPFSTAVTNNSVVTSMIAPFSTAVTNTSVVTSMFTPFSTAVTNTSVVTSMFAPFPTAVSNSDVVTSMYTPPQTLVTMDLTKTSVVTSMFAPFPTAVTNTSVVTSMIAPFSTAVTNNSVVTSMFAPLPTAVKTDPEPQQENRTTLRNCISDDEEVNTETGNDIDTMTWGETLDSQKSSLRWDIKRTIKMLCKQLSDIGEECFVVTCNVNNGWVSHLGSVYGNDFINENINVTYKFLNYCRESADAIDFQARPTEPERSESIDRTVDDGRPIKLEYLPDLEPPRVIFNDTRETQQSTDVEMPNKVSIPKKLLSVKLPKFKRKKLKSDKPGFRLSLTTKVGGFGKEKTAIPKRSEYSCTLCNKTFKYNSQYEKHILGEQHQKNIYRDIVCYKCNNEFDGICELFYHVTKCKGDRHKRKSDELKQRSEVKQEAEDMETDASGS